MRALKDLILLHEMKFFASIIGAVFPFFVLHLKKCNETRLRDQLPLLMNDENKCILFCKRAFSDVLEGVFSKNFSGSKPLDPHFSVRYL